MHRMQVPTGPHNRTINVKVTQQTRTRLDRLAEVYGCTRTDVVEAAIGHLADTLAGKLKERDDA